MAQKAKRRTKGIPVVRPIHNGNGFHKNHSWVPGDPIENHPLAGAMGAFKDDPLWDEFIQAMKDARHEEDERYFKTLEDEP
jgi:hypothetical protein